MTGLGGTPAGSTSHAINIKLFNQTHQLVCQTQALVLPTITSYSAHAPGPLTKWNHLKGLNFADDLSATDEIQLLIGADLYGSILLNQIRKGRINEPVAQQTVYGWVVFGPCSNVNPTIELSVPVHHSIAVNDIDQLLQRFWEVESLPQQPIISPADEECEIHFLKTHSRTNEGRYVVRMPFKLNMAPQVGQSRSIAERLLKKVETRLSSNPAHQLLYSEFMNDYESLGHMTRVDSGQSNKSSIIYIPHHPIIRDQNPTTRLRVVFNASCKTSNGTSLNECMLTGPKLQSELFLILMQWRSYPLVLVADITKMYRQILIHILDRDYQCILWRPTTESPPVDYQLNTVTYGTRSAPYLALRVLKQLVLDEGLQYPLAALVLNHDTFVDDILFGAYNLEDAFKVRDQVIALLEKAKLELHKWASNDSRLVSNIHPTEYGLEWNSLSHDNRGVKVLGLRWHPSTDTFTFSLDLDLPSTLSKRQALSILSQLFDPLGWISPVVVNGKILMQQLWLLEIPWDEVMNDSVSRHWFDYFESLYTLSQIQIPRWNGFHVNNQSSELHGFCDASNKAYGAVVYLRTMNELGIVGVSLLVSKTKVAPIKQVSIHRLELQAALLLAQLCTELRGARAFSHVPIQCWTDSSITLAWLRRHASTWKLFVSNRVAAIHELLPDHQWRHVPTLSNPADLASRGCTPNDLATSSLWWAGPNWLHQPPSQWPTMFFDPPPEDAMEIKVKVLHAVDDSNDPLYIVVNKFSSWLKVVRITAYLLRYKNNLKAKSRHINSATGAKVSVWFGPLSSQELDKAKILMYVFLQRQMFFTELQALQKGLSVPSHSKLSSLNQFIDQATGVLRVGGRLDHSALPYEARHPVILHAHPLVSSIIRYIHMRCLHGGMKPTLSTLRQTIWLINPRPQIKSVIFKCLPCAQIRAKLSSQLMADLPKSRVTPSSRAFSSCGIDYAGPLQVRMAGGRGIRSQQCYICVFVCLAVKAIHLELVSDYSSPAFIASFRRFISRRGTPSHLYSDRGTTFQGADRLLHEEYIKTVSSLPFQSFVTEEHIQWHFIPPAAPHFGGIWEAGVKSVKTHLKRVLLDQTPTYEELTTLLCQIEAVLNSRPLGPLNDLVDDLNPLTPGHFLTGGPLNLVQQCSLLDSNSNRLTRWARMQKNLELFWTKWSHDYLQSLQHRTKWQLPEMELKIGHMVLLKQPNCPPAKWNIARVIECFPGSDGHVRTVKVKTAKSEYLRPITELVLLPIDLEEKDCN